MGNQDDAVFLFVQLSPCCWRLMALYTELIFSVSSNTCLPVTDMERTRETEKLSPGRGSSNGINPDLPVLRLFSDNEDMKRWGKPKSM